MDKRKLNNEIILCRPAVRKARVAVIRKLFKKIKILKACKAEIGKQKKLKKSERLFEKAQIIKKIKDDEVTKFALQSKDLDDFLKGPNVNLRQNALACLAKHKAVMNKIKSIKEQFLNWEVELPALLDSLGKKKNNKADIFKAKTKRINSNTSLSHKNEVHEVNKTIKESEVILRKYTPENSKTKWTKTIPDEYATFRGENVNSKQSEGWNKNNSSLTNTVHENRMNKIEKIDDPFFIEKKVAMPKLISKNLLAQKNAYKEEKLENYRIKNINTTSAFKRSFRSEKNLDKCRIGKLISQSEKELHPSWAAKKIKLIKPFEGTKIKFSDN